MHALVSSHFKKRYKNKLKIYFGGARSGDSGGPLVKVTRLKKAFGEHRFNYNVLYVLSNAPYLPEYGYRCIKRNKIPIVLNQNGVFYQAWYEGDWKKQNKKMAIPYHIADYVFYQSKFCKYAAEIFLGKRNGESEILYNAVDTDFFKPNKKSLLKEAEPFTFLITGQIGKHLFYRIESTLRGMAIAIKEGLNAKIIIAGGLDDFTMSASIALVEELNISNDVTFFGPYSQNEAPSIYNRANAYVMTKHNDPCPNAVIEALSCGLPILYSNSGGVPELVGKNAGIALKCEESWQYTHTPSSKDISSGMLEIAEKYEKMSIYSRKRAVEKFGIKDWIKRHKKI